MTRWDAMTRLNEAEVLDTVESEDDRNAVRIGAISIEAVVKATDLIHERQQKYTTMSEVDRAVRRELGKVWLLMIQTLAEVEE